MTGPSGGPTGQALWMRIYTLAQAGAEPHPQLIQQADAERGPLGESFLHWLCLEGDTAVIDRILGADLDVNVQNALGNTPLMEAAAQGRWDLAKVLVRHGADPELRNHDGEDLSEYLELYGVELPEGFF